MSLARRCNLIQFARATRGAASVPGEAWRIQVLNAAAVVATVLLVVAAAVLVMNNTERSYGKVAACRCVAHVLASSRQTIAQHSLHAALLAAAPALARSLAAWVRLQLQVLPLQQNPCERTVAVRANAGCRPALLDHSLTHTLCRAPAAAAGQAVPQPHPAVATAVAAFVSAAAAVAAALRAAVTLNPAGCPCCFAGCPGCPCCAGHARQLTAD